MRCEEFRRRPFGCRLPGDGFDAVLAELKRRGMLRIGPRATRAIESVRLVHAEETASFLYDGPLTANGIGHGFQRAPPRCGALVLANAFDIIFAHRALHSAGN